MPVGVAVPLSYPRVSNDLLINFASRAEMPSAPDREMSSEPAKSMKVNVDSVSSVPHRLKLVTMVKT